MSSLKSRSSAVTRVATSAALVFSTFLPACENKLACLTNCSTPDTFVSPSRNLTPVEEIGRVGTRVIGDRSIPIYSISDSPVALIGQNAAYVRSTNTNSTSLGIGTSVDLTLIVDGNTATGSFGFRGTTWINSVDVEGFGINPRNVFVDVSEGIENPNRTHHRICALGSNAGANESYAFCTNVQIRPVGYTRYELAIVRSP